MTLKPLRQAWLLICTWPIFAHAQLAYAQLVQPAPFLNELSISDGSSIGDASASAGGTTLPVAEGSEQPAIIATPNGRIEQYSSVDPSAPRPMVVRLPSAIGTRNGELIVSPNVAAGMMPEGGVWNLAPDGSSWQSPGKYPTGNQGGSVLTGPQSFMASHVPQQPDSTSVLPAPQGVDSGSRFPRPVFEEILAEEAGDSPVMPVPMSRGPIYAQDPFEGPRVGHERLAFALFDIESAQPLTNFRIRTLAAYGRNFPDRSEYFWARTVDGAGPPLPERSVDYQDLRMRLEMGSKAFSTAFEVPFRAVNPEVNSNHAGLGDLQITIKTVLVDGKAWQLTPLFAIHMNTGRAVAGLGTGHVTLEPGVLLRYIWNEETWLHWQLKYWVPTGANPLHAGDLVTFGLGINHVWRESDYRAIIPSLELVSYSFQSGLARTPAGGLINADGIHAFQLTPGVHYVIDNGCDFGLLEVGSFMGLSFSDERLYQSQLGFEIRWSF